MKYYGNYGIVLSIKKTDAARGCHPGQCDKDVKELSQKPYIARQLNKLDPGQVKQELFDCGAWDDQELQDHNENLQRILWIACGDIVDGSNHTK